MSRTDGWWETRLGLKSWTRAILDEDIPGGSKFSYALGSATMFTFLLLCLTGIFQLMYYVPSIA
jgi:ubiquinol-cytochrome c reductase cytochrome b subunit